ncbi:hypothetical protein ABZ791_19735 [Streptomyces huasconensis]|uniref:Uncharacterized protein n=1 Tax=Streptomyces huasconensis TaxID=1854574 RepID=A0ABV3M5R3_9ACTN
MPPGEGRLPKRGGGPGTHGDPLEFVSRRGPQEIGAVGAQAGRDGSVG